MERGPKPIAGAAGRTSASPRSTSYAVAPAGLAAEPLAPAGAATARAAARDHADAFASGASEGAGS